MSSNRNLSYSLAINEAIRQMMEKDSGVLIMGQGTKSPWYVGNTCQDLLEKFGEKRVIDTPISENAMTGAAVSTLKVLVSLVFVLESSSIQVMLQASFPS